MVADGWPQFFEVPLRRLAGRTLREQPHERFFAETASVAAYCIQKRRRPQGAIMEYLNTRNTDPKFSSASSLSAKSAKKPPVRRRAP